jgi:hypothetical protein
MTTGRINQVYEFIFSSLLRERNSSVAFCLILLFADNFYQRLFAFSENLLLKFRFQRKFLILEHLSDYSFTVDLLGHHSFERQLSLN